MLAISVILVAHVCWWQVSGPRLTELHRNLRNVRTAASRPLATANCGHPSVPLPATNLFDEARVRRALLRPRPARHAVKSA